MNLPNCVPQEQMEFFERHNETMNYKNLNELLEEYREIDLDMAILQKRKDLLKTKVKNRMSEEDLDNIKLGDFSVSVSEFDRVLYLKKNLEQYVDKKTLNKCKKVITITTTNIRYKK